MASSPGEVRSLLHHGLIPAVPVPFTAGGEIDHEAQERYIAYMAAQPVAGIAVWAHTGRGLRLTREQRLQVLRSWSEGLGANQTSSPRIVVAGVGGTAGMGTDFPAFVESALAMAGDARDGGASALLVHPPTPFRDSPAHREASIVDYHRQLASVGVPLILFYLYEAAGGISYSPELLGQLFAMPEVVGIKLATLDSVMTFQNVANLVADAFPEKLLITGEDRFLGYSLMCGAEGALIGMGAACTELHYDLMRACFDERAADFLALSRKVDQLSQVLFIPPMEGYIRRMLWTLVHLGVFGRESAHDPWGPDLPESEFVELEDMLRRLGQM